MALSNEIVLRPRFKFDLRHRNVDLLNAFELEKERQAEFIISRIDDHVFIKLPKQDQHFWSPQLHLEINELDSKSSTLHGLFGPNPTVWTLFMFLHFVVAALFIAFGIWTYTNWSLGNSYAVTLFVMLLMLVVWFLLYFFGRIGRTKGKGEMHRLHDFMNKVLEAYR